MHCPSCGQEQASVEIKFCSRCGFPLGLVSEILAHGGFLPQLAELHKSRKPKFTKKHGVIFSVFWFMFFLFLMAPLVDKQDRVLRAANFVHHRLDALFKLAAILCAGDHHGEVEHDDPAIA